MKAKSIMVKKKPAPATEPPQAVSFDAAKKADEPTWLAYTVYGHPYARLQ